MVVTAPMPVRAVPNEGDAESKRSEATSTASVLKALRVLGCFEGSPEPLGVSELARRAGAHKSTVFRMLAFLEQAGFVERSGRSYVLGSHLLHLGRQAGHTRYARLRAAAMPTLTELFAATRAIVLLVVEEGGEAVVLDRIYGPELAVQAADIPTHTPLHCAAAGKALLAFGDQHRLERVLEQPLARVTARTIDSAEKLREQLTYSRARRIAFDVQEAVPALASLAVPIMNDHGAADGVISIVVPPFRINDEGLGRALKSAAIAIAERYRQAHAG